ncbi:MAG: pterin-4a-carbinolamine dehydratase [Parcubacteria group bacterium Greene0714_21]|nr:MAG: pterin-4a-carbinolamine dehydratase [Parcubacteria group bacterium Greene0416_39]TSC97548.1 MAG: pterin-4a-carbinolamine dehydratase [Parcubacteria group bacterium Greene1014_47]TSD04424.1 MAG: pterin-4a-carbinolamine dehydratase [Parcubacteria group bacterium Greene0714_21]
MLPYKLIEKKCVPCEARHSTVPGEGGAQPFTVSQIRDYLVQLNPSTSSEQEWEVLDDKKIKKQFKFKNFKEAIAFVNKVAELAEQEGHHPDVRIFGYKNVEIELSTHAINGLSENDFILAAKIEQLV